MPWQISNKSLTKEFELRNFKEAVGFVNKILPLAEKANHH